MKHLYKTIILLLFGTQIVFSQDIEKLKNFKLKNLFKEGIKVSGGIMANHTYYNAWGIDNRRTPFAYIYTGNLNASLFGKINIPISFSFTNQRANFSSPFANGLPKIQPFNRLSFKPKYKGSTFTRFV